MRKVVHILRREFIDVRFFRFLVFGATTAAVNLAVGGFLYSNETTEQFVPYWLAVGVGGLAALVLGFFLNYFFNFRFAGRSLLSMFWTYTIVSMGALGLSVVFAAIYLALTGLLFEGPGFHLGPHFVSYEFASHFCSVGTIAIYSYLSHKYVSFNIGLRERLRSIYWR